MRSYARRVDEETGAPHMRVSQAHDYKVATVLWRRTIPGAGTIECELLRSTSGPAMRIVQLHGRYTDFDDTVCDEIVRVDDEREEAQLAARLERRIRLARARPSEQHA